MAKNLFDTFWGILAGRRPPPKPTRLSVDFDDQGYPAWNRLKREGRVVRILLDGHPVDNVIMADEENGLINRYIRGPDGNLVISEGRYVDVYQEGNVEIVIE